MRRVRWFASVILAVAVSGVVAAEPAHAAPPPNDNFASAEVIAGASGTVTGTTVEATAEPNEPIHASIAPEHSVWYRWTAPTNAYMAFDVCGTSANERLAIYTGASVDALTRVAQNNSHQRCDRARVAFKATAGVQYHIAVDGTAAFSLNWAATLSGKSLADFDGAGTTDIAVYRPSTGQWFVLGGSPEVTQYGVPGDIPLVADFNANGASEKAIYRPSTGQWIRKGLSPEVVQYGSTGDIPVPMQVDQNGTSDFAIFRPGTAQWFRRSFSPELVQYGVNSDIPVPGDYDGDSDDEIAVYRPSTGHWFRRGIAPELVQYGVPGDIPIPGDYDGNGTTDIAVYRPSTGQWFVRGGSPEVTQYGVPCTVNCATDGDIPVPGDYDGNVALATTDLAIYRPSTGQWFVLGGLPEVTQYGSLDDVPIPLPYHIRRVFFP